MLVSVIVPVHNVADCLETTLACVVAQTHRPLEICAVDDGSTDASGAILARWKADVDAGVHAGITMVVEHSEGARLGADGRPTGGSAGYARNRAVALSHGAFLCLLDSDDEMAPDRVRLQLERAQEVPGALVGARFVRDPPDATPRYAAWSNGLREADFAQHEFRELPLIQPTWFMARATWDRVGGYPELVRGLEAVRRMPSAPAEEAGDATTTEDEEGGARAGRKRQRERRDALEVEAEVGNEDEDEVRTGYESFAVPPRSHAGGEGCEKVDPRAQAATEALCSAYNAVVASLRRSRLRELRIAAIKRAKHRQRVERERFLRETRGVDLRAGGGEAASGEATGEAGAAGLAVASSIGKVNDVSLPEDLIFYHAHRAAGGALVRAGGDDGPALVTYRFTATSQSWRVPRIVLMAVRARAVEERVLQGAWRDRPSFSIWGAGRDGSTFFRFLSPAARRRVAAFADIDPAKIGTRVRRQADGDEPRADDGGGAGPGGGAGGDAGVPVVHFRDLSPPVVTCVALDRTDGAFEANLASLQLPASDVLYFA